MIIPILLIVLVAAYLFAIRGRRGHPGLSQLRRYHYAHRGLHGKGIPENSMAAFRAALEQGYGIELDLHLMKDGTLAVIHDSSLRRTAGSEEVIEELTAADLGRFSLEGTEETIPTFSQVLALFQGKAPLIIELKPADGNHAALTDAVCRMLRTYPGSYCIESFDPRCLYHLKKHYPHIIRGQLAMNNMTGRGDQPWIIRFLMTHHLLNFLTAPDFIAYHFPQRNATPSNFLCRKLWKVQGVAWTLRDPTSHNAALQEGWLSIFEGFRP